MFFRQRRKGPPAESLAPPSEPSERDTFVFSKFSLRSEDMEIPLAEGETTLGRSLDCGVVVDIRTVSRRHAVLLVDGSRVVLGDNGSCNGVIVNGTPIREERRLKLGDSFAIGGNVFELIARSGAMRDRSCTEPPPRITRPGLPGVPPTQVTAKGSAFDLLGVIADKALALNHHEEAVRLLGGHIQSTHRGVVRGVPVEEDLVIAAATYAIGIAAAAKDGSWAEISFEMLSKRELVPASDTVDLLYPIAAELRLCYPLLQRYLRTMTARRGKLAPTDQFALKRIEGLERLVALKGP